MSAASNTTNLGPDLGVNNSGMCTCVTLTLTPLFVDDRDASAHDCGVQETGGFQYKSIELNQLERLSTKELVLGH